MKLPSKIKFEGKQMEFIEVELEVFDTTIKMQIPEHDPDHYYIAITDDNGLLICPFDKTIPFKDFNLDNIAIFLEDRNLIAFETHSVYQASAVTQDINEERLCGFVDIKDIQKILTKIELKSYQTDISVFESMQLKKYKGIIEASQGNEFIYEDQDGIHII
jgi:hypothetical protein